MDIRLREVWAKRRLNGTSKVNRQTDTHTDRHLTEKKEVNMTEQNQHEEETVTASSTHIKETQERFDQRLKGKNRIKIAAEDPAS